MSKGRERGFTLIELLIVIAIIGVIAAILIPNLLTSLHKAKQKRTVADMKEVGTAWFSWFTDQVSAGAAGASQSYTFGNLSSTLTGEQLLSTLFVDADMFYIRSVPDNDGWGHTYEYAWSEDLTASQVFGIRSPGRDGSLGSPTADPYPVGPFATTAFDEDIVWADGLFVRYPLGARVE